MGHGQARWVLGRRRGAGPLPGGVPAGLSLRRPFLSIRSLQKCPSLHFRLIKKDSE